MLSIQLASFFLSLSIVIPPSLLLLLSLSLEAYQLVYKTGFRFTTMRNNLTLLSLLVHIVTIGSLKYAHLSN